MPKVRYQLLFLSFVVLGIYYPALFVPYCLTDDCIMVERLLNQDHVSVLGLLFPHGSGQYYRPLVYSTFFADKYLWGLEASFMHLENVFLHLLNVLLVFVVTSKLARVWKMEDPGWMPLVAGMIFAVHPINTESVLWISGRTDVMAGSFVLFSLWALAEYLTSRRLLWVAVASISVLLGALAKETGIMFAPAAAFLVLCHDHRFFPPEVLVARLRRMAAPVAILGAGGLAYVAMRSVALSVKDAGLSAVSTLSRAPGTDYLNLARVFCKASGFYLKKLFLPLPLNFGIVEVSNYYVVPGVFFVLLLVYLVWRRTLGSALTVAAFSILVPCFLLVVSQLSWTPVAERYLYMPAAFFSILAASWVVAGFRSTALRPLVAILGVPILVGAAYATTGRGILWQDNYALSADTAAKSPYFAAARNDMAVELMRRGKTSEARGIFHDNASDGFQLASLNMVGVYMSEGKLPEARRILYARLNGKDQRYPLDVLKLLVKVTELRRKQSKDPREVEALNRELLDLETRQYKLSGDPFFLYRQGLTHLQLKDRRAAFASFSGARSAAPADSHYRQAAIQLAQKYRP